MTVRTFTPLNKFMTELEGMVLEFPHTAIRSSSPKFNTTFHNVYYRSEVEKWLDTIDLNPDEPYILVGRLAAQGYTVKFLPRNKQGYCQCSITAPKVDWQDHNYVLTGEAGKMHDAVLSAFVKHALCLIQDDEGNSFWSSKELADRTTRRFR